MAKFDTSQINKIYPGLSPTQGVVDKSGYLERGMGAEVAGAFEQFLDTGTKIHEIDVLEEAEKNAYDLADQYYNQSGSPDAFDTMLDAENQKLMNLKNQGIVNPYEFKQRVLARNQELANNNPAYSDKIAAKIEDVFKKTGVSNALKYDEARYKKELDAQYKYAEEQDKLLSKYGLDGKVMDPLEKQSKYHELLKIDSYANILSASDAKDSLKAKEAATFALKKLDEAGGPAELKKITYASVNNSLEEILNDPNKDDRQKQLAARKVINERREFYDKTKYEIIAAADKNPVAKQYITEMDEMFKNFMTTFDKDFKLEDIKARKEAINAITDADLKKDWLDTVGKNKYTRESLLQTLEILTKEEKLLLNVPGARTQISKLIEALTDLQTNPNNKVDPTVFDLPAVKSHVNKTKTNATKELAENNNQLTEATHSELVKEQAAIEQSSGSKRIADMDNTLRTYMVMDNEAFRQLMENNGTQFRAKFKNNLEYYKKATSQYMIDTYLQEGETDFTDKVEVDASTGRLYSTDPLLSIDLARINNYISIKSKIAGKPSAEMTDQILGEEFPFLGFGQKQEPVVVNSKEEWQQLPPGMPFIIMDNGKEAGRGVK